MNSDDKRSEKDRIMELLKEAAKRHAEIEQKIHPKTEEEQELKEEEQPAVETKTEIVSETGNEENNLTLVKNESHSEIPESEELNEKVEEKIEPSLADESFIETRPVVPEKIFDIKDEPAFRKEDLIMHKTNESSEDFFKEETEPAQNLLNSISFMQSIHSAETFTDKLKSEDQENESTGTAEVNPMDTVKEVSEKIVETEKKPVHFEIISEGSKLPPLEITIDKVNEIVEIKESTESPEIVNEELQVNETNGTIFDEVYKELIPSAYLPDEEKVQIEEQEQMKEAEQPEQIEQEKDELISNEVTESKVTEEDVLPTISTSVAAEEKQEEIPVKTILPEKAMTDFDLHLFSQGTYYKIYDKFGSHITFENGLRGVRFTTWAPNAEEIYVIGEFNGWQESEKYKLQKDGSSGVWSGFIPGLIDGDTYKFVIRSMADGQKRRKADPYAFRSEVRPKNASIISELSGYEWKDDKWMSARGGSDFKDKPMNIYEVHLGSWRRDYDNPEFPNEWGYLSYAQLAKEIVAYVKKMGYTHIELLPVMEHPLDISWGYQVTHYYAPTSRFGSPHDFMYFVDYCHQNGIGVILDWVPAHFPYDEHALAYFDGKQIYAYENVKRGIHKDWGTYIFDYGKPEVQNFLIGSALFWLDKYHADGLRVDAVASMLYLDYSREQGEWEPNIHGGREHLEAIGFLKHLNEKVHEYHKGAVMIAEESTSWPGVSHPISQGGLGFDMKWNMGWMNDILLYFSKDPVHRKFHQGKITFSLWYAFSENFVLPISHDEVVHGKKSLLEKMPGDNWQKFANLRLFLGFMTGHPGKKLNFMSTDFAQYNEWNCETSLEWGLVELDLNKKLNLFVSDLNKIYGGEPSLFEVDFNSAGFQWIDFSDALHSVLSFIRTSKDKKETLLFTFNMTPTVRYDYPVGVPEAGFWKEILNSDAEVYGGRTESETWADENQSR